MSIPTTLTEQDPDRTQVGPTSGRIIFWRRSFGAARREPLGVAGAVLLVAMVAVALAAPVLAPHNPARADASTLYAAPSSKYLLGTDAYGRDILSRLIYGSRVSLLVGLGASLVGVLVGAGLGIACSFRGGWADTLLQRVMDALLAFPMLLLALAMAAALGPSVHNVVIALALPIVPLAARIARSTVLTIKVSPFFEAARAIGCGDLRIMLHHLLPNAVGPLLIIATAYLGLAITQEAALDYLGVGIQEPQASWGLMLSGPAVTLARIAPWIVIFPGIAICIAVLASSLVGDWIRDLMDPRIRRR